MTGGTPSAVIRRYQEHVREHGGPSFPPLGERAYAPRPHGPPIASAENAQLRSWGWGSAELRRWQRDFQPRM